MVFASQVGVCSTKLRIVAAAAVIVVIVAAMSNNDKIHKKTWQCVLNYTLTYAQ
jgi:hypothetical protein